MWFAEQVCYLIAVWWWEGFEIIAEINEKYFGHSFIH